MLIVVVAFCQRADLRFFTRTVYWYRLRCPSSLSSRRRRQHLDMKPGNMLVLSLDAFATHTIKLTDFGMSRESNNRLVRRCPPPRRRSRRCPDHGWRVCRGHVAISRARCGVCVVLSLLFAFAHASLCFAEMLNKVQSERADVYSLGMCLWEVRRATPLVVSRLSAARRRC